MKKVLKGDPRFVNITNCYGLEVFKQISPHTHYARILFKFVYKIDDEKDIFPEYAEVSVRGGISYIFRNINQMLNDDTESQKVYLSDGMANIDMYLEQGKLVILHSPSDGSIITYKFTEEETKNFKHLIQLLMPNN